MAYIVKTYKDDHNWYVLYSNGYVDQGGHGEYKSKTTVTVTHQIPFKNSFYDIQHTIGTDSTDTDFGVRGVGVLTGKTATDFRYYNFSRYYRAFGVSNQSPTQSNIKRIIKY